MEISRRDLGLVLSALAALPAAGDTQDLPSKVYRQARVVTLSNVNPF